MASSPSTVLTEGFGPWASVFDLAPLGYGSGVAQPDGPVCGTLSVDAVLAGTLTIEGCGSVGNILYINEDVRVKLTGLSYETDLGGTTYLNAATITYALKDALGATVAGGTGTLDYIATTNGNYAAVIDKAVTVLLAEGARYFLHVPIAEGNRDGYRRLSLRAEYHA